MKTKNDMERNRSHIGRKVRKREIDSSLARGAETLMRDAQRVKTEHGDHPVY